MEEAGKLILVSNLFGRSVDARMSDIRLHKSKQKAAASVAMMTLGIYELFHMVKACGHHLGRVRIMNETFSNEITIEDVFESMTDNAFSKVSRKLRYPRQTEILVRAFRGEFDKIKQQGFYIDPAKPGHVLAQPPEIDRETSDRIIRLASRTLSVIQKELARRVLRSGRKYLDGNMKDLCKSIP